MERWAREGGSRPLREPSAVDIRVALAEAWDHYYTRWPDGVTPQMLERLVHEPSAPGCHVRRTLWDLVLHHTANAASIHARQLITEDRARSTAEREAAVAFARDVQASSGALSALRMGRLAHLIGASEEEDLMGGLVMFSNDMEIVLPWVALFSRYMNAAHPKAGRWWSETCNRSVKLTRSVEEAERRMAVTVARAWAASLLMAQSSATELVAVSPSSELAKDTVFEITHALGKIQSLRLIPRPVTTAHDATRWAKRVLRKGSPRLMKILGEQFVLFGGSGRPPGRA